MRLAGKGHPQLVAAGARSSDRMIQDCMRAPRLSMARFLCFTLQH